MTNLTLSNLQISSGAKKKKRRLGRGNASGKGNYSGRGIKGQRARSGGKSQLTLKGLKTFLQRIPKTKGFKAIQQPLANVNIGLLNKFFKAGDEITPLILLRRGLVKNIRSGVKILGEGQLSKKLTIKAQAFSKKAKNAILRAGGKAEIIK